LYFIVYCAFICKINDDDGAGGNHRCNKRLQRSQKFLTNAFVIFVNFIILINVASNLEKSFVE